MIKFGLSYARAYGMISVYGIRHFAVSREREGMTGAEVKMDACVLEAKGVRKSYTVGDITAEVLKGVDLFVEEGEFVAVLGESGSGKSTLLYILAGIDKPTEGSVTLIGRDLASSPLTRTSCSR